MNAKYWMTIPALLLLAVAPLNVTAGSVARLFYEGDSTSVDSATVRQSVSTLKNAASFPDQPTFREQLDDFNPAPNGALIYGLQGRDNSGTDFGSWIHGYLEAPQNGDYVFYIASDDNAELWLSTDHAETTKRVIAFESQSGITLFDGLRLDQRRSQSISLVRGNKYYFEVFHQQGGGIAFLQVGWRRPDGVEEIIPALHLAQHPVDPFLNRLTPNAAPFFNTDGLNGGDLPASVNVAEGQRLLLETDVIAAQPAIFVWRRNGQVIAGENLSYLALDSISASANGDQFQVTISNGQGTLSSATTVLAVTPDTLAPQVTLVDHRGNPNGVRVTFSEPVQEDAATNLSHYSLQGPGGAVLVIQSAKSLNAGTSVQLAGIFNFQVGQSYQLTVRDIKDQALTANSLDPNPTVSSFSFVAPVDGGLGPVSITTDLQDVQAAENQAVDLSVQLAGASPFYYQWYFNNTAILPETNHVLHFTATAGAVGQYKVVISNEFSSVTSRVAAVGFIKDTTPPRLVSIRGLAGANSEVQLEFDEALDISTATNASIYRVDGLQILSARLSADARWVILTTSPQNIGFSYVLHIYGLKDISVAGNALTTLVRFRGTKTYSEEALADQPVRYWRFEEAENSGTVDSLVTLLDPLITGQSVLVNGPKLGVPGLVSNLVGSTAIQFDAARIQSITVPNGSDLNINTGPWDKRTISFWFKATSLPSGGAAKGSAVIFEAGGVNRGYGIYLYGSQDVANPSEALLAFNAFNNLTDGPGSPWGTKSGDGSSSVYVSTPVQTGQVYHVVAVLDGDKTGTAGELRLYLNGTLAGTAKGAGQLYNHSSNIQIGNGTILLHDGVNPSNKSPFDGVIDELAIYNTALTTERVTVLYNFANTVDVGIQQQPLTITQVDTRGNPNGVRVLFSDFLSPALATAIDHYTLSSANGTPLAIQSATLLDDASSVQLAGSFNFQPGQSYQLLAHDLKDSSPTGRTLQPNPTSLPLTYQASSGVLYDFNGALPATIKKYGNTEVRTNNSYDGSGYLKLTDGSSNQNGSILFTERNDVEQIRVSFKTRISDASIPAGEGFSFNLASDLPAGTYPYPEEGYNANAITTTGQGFIVAFDTAKSGLADVSPSIAVKWKGQVITNVPTGVAPVPALTTTGWVDVDINLKRDGRLTLTYGGTTILEQFSTGFTGLKNAQIGFGARTSSAFESHWLDDIRINYADGDLGPVTIQSGTDLVDRTINETATTTFSIVPQGASPFKYQWYQNNTALAGETNRLLQVVGAPATAGQYYVTISNEFSGVISRTASLVVQPDTLPPRIVAVRGLATIRSEVEIQFDEALSPATATNASLYSVDRAQILSASQSADGRSVVLETSPLTPDANYVLHLNGITDQSISASPLFAQVNFVTSRHYNDEIVADVPARYWRFEEIDGSPIANSLTTINDPLTTGQATLVNGPQFGVPGLVANLGGSTAIQFDGARNQSINVPNGVDVNITSGPWAKKSISLWFKATSLPRGGSTNGSAVVFEQGGANRGLTLYLYGSQDVANPTEALLVLNAFNNLSEGAGSPWGTKVGDGSTSVYVSAPIRLGEVYDVVAVLDGDTNGVAGELRLYTNGVLAGTAPGAGQLYNHSSNIQIANGDVLLHDGGNPASKSPFSGILDELALFNEALTGERVTALHQLAITHDASNLIPPAVQTVDHRGNPNGVRVTFNEPVDPATSTNLANYSLRSLAGANVPITTAVLLADQSSVQLAGSFNFQLGTQYELTIRDVLDQAAQPSRLTPNPTVVTFAFAAPAGQPYNIGPVGIVPGHDLTNLTGLENSVVILTVTPTGASPYTYEWYRNNTVLPGVTNRELTLVLSANTEGSYRVTLRNEFSETSSSTAQVTVQSDIAAPVLQQVRGFGGTLNEVRLVFDEPVDEVTATNTANYAVAPLQILGAILDSSARQVTLRTSPQTTGQAYQLTISGIRDRAGIPNVLNTKVTFQTEVSYAEEVLADDPVRYWPFGETNGSIAYSLTAKLDTLITAQGTYINGPKLGVPGLATNLNRTAVQLDAAQKQSITIPNGSDLNGTVGPWAKKTVEFWFKAASLPRGGTNVQAPVLYKQGAGNRGLGLYLYGTQDSDTPDEALLVWQALNNKSEGPGSPWGNLLGSSNSAVYVSAPVRVNESYHVVAVLDGDNSGFAGQLRLYTNGILAGEAVGAGQIYNHTGSGTQIGNGDKFLRHDGVVVSTNDFFSGVIDELSLYNHALTSDRVTAHYQAAVTPPPLLVLPVFGGYRVESKTLIITWEGAARLQRASDIKGPFTEVDGAASPYRESSTNNTIGFFRLVR